MERNAVFLKVSTPTLLAATATTLLAAIALLPAPRASVANDRPIDRPIARPPTGPEIDQPGCVVPATSLDYTPRELETRWYESHRIDLLSGEIDGALPAWENVLWLGDAQPRTAVVTPLLSLGTHRTGWTPVEDRFGGIWLVEREQEPDHALRGRYARRIWLLPDRQLFRGLLDASYQPLLVLP